MSTSTDTKYPEVEVQLTGEDGNAFFIAARVRKAIQKHVRDTFDGERSESFAAAEAEGKAFFDEALSGDYDHVLQTCMKWVSVS